MANKLNKRCKKCYHNNLNKQPVQKGQKVDDWLNPLLILFFLFVLYPILNHTLKFVTCIWFYNLSTHQEIHIFTDIHTHTLKALLPPAKTLHCILNRVMLGHCFSSVLILFHYFTPHTEMQNLFSVAQIQGCFKCNFEQKCEGIKHYIFRKQIELIMYKAINVKIHQISEFEYF